MTTSTLRLTPGQFDSIAPGDWMWEQDLITNKYLLRGIQPSKHFNCKRCGAINQIDVCEYCGSAYEEGESK